MKLHFNGSTRDFSFIRLLNNAFELKDIISAIKISLQNMSIMSQMFGISDFLRACHNIKGDKKKGMLFAGSEIKRG